MLKLSSRKLGNPAQPYYLLRSYPSANMSQDNHLANFDKKKINQLPRGKKSEFLIILRVLPGRVAHLFLLKASARWISSRKTAGYNLRQESRLILVTMG